MIYKGMLTSFVSALRRSGIASLVAQDFWASECPAVFTRRLRVTIPDEGFAYAGVQRQVLTYGNEDALKTVPLALLIELP